ncbi:MAG: DoxX family protein [Myxococcales bacterium]|nr:DoxX family protein [Myxococcales bacterium]
MRVIGHIFALLLALAFAVAGGSKILGNEMHVENFTRWNYPLWFMTLTGVLELLAALLVLIPFTRLVGAGLLVALMVGATGTHVINGEMLQSVPAAVLGLLALATGLMRPRRQD